MPYAKGSKKQPSRPRIRAGKACKRCNEKRVKCDAMLRMPCSNCVHDANAECTLRESKRGTYNRRVRDQNPSAEVDNVEDDPTRLATEFSNTLQSAESAIPLSLQGGETGASVIAEVAAPDPISALHQSADAQLFAHNPSVSVPLDHYNNVSTQEDQSSDAPPISPLHTNRAPSPRPAPVAKDSLPAQRSQGDVDTTSSYRDISWSAMFDHFLNSRQDSREFVDKCSITYLGESFPLAIVLGDVNESGRQKLHHPGPPFPDKGATKDVTSQDRRTHLMPEDFEYLHAKGVFEIPEKAQLDSLISVFLESVYPLYPIVSRQELIQQHKNGAIPLILLHSISFIAVTFCPLSVLLSVGFFSRREARAHFYKKVKALFDSGYEVNKLVILQSAILMSFWGGGPNNYWNFYSWVSTAVTIAEAVGIHRSTATTNMQPQDKSLLRRLWWILVVRDSVCSALVGRPFRIDMDQSDTEMLTIEDFAHDATSSVFLEDSAHQRYALYQINVAKLSLILRDIVMSRFYPGRPPIPSEQLHEKLTYWKQGLPQTLHWGEDEADHQNPFSISLFVQYNHHLILIYIGHPPDENICPRMEREREEITNSAAQTISAAACSIVTKSSFLSVPHEMFHGIFLAQAVFYTKLKSSNQLMAQLGRSALNNCQMVLHTVSDCWDPGPWIMQLFEGLSARRLDRESGSQEQSSHATMTVETPWLNGVMGSTPEAGVFNGLLRDDAWKNNPMLSSLFENPPDILLQEP
ncbi:unnamed protein product [Penicillium olsonii]|nr:unnamed protein product [Penicillium olsonii]